jgi:hypothetical protein
MLKCLQDHECEFGEPCKTQCSAAKRSAYLFIPACQGDFKRLYEGIPLTSFDISCCTQEHEAELRDLQGRRAAAGTPNTREIARE